MKIEKRIADIHVHILPGVDDGAKNTDETLEMLRLAWSEGITDMIVTPHYQSGRYFTIADMVKEKTNQIQKLAADNHIPIRLYPGTEIYYRKGLEERLDKDENVNDLPKTIISREYSSEWKSGDEPYYPVNDEKNGKLYAKYRKMADREKNVIFGGRLGEYKYYDMDAVIASALDMCEKELQQFSYMRSGVESTIPDWSVLHPQSFHVH